MRLLVDVHGVDWKEAWRITQATFSYTNHTLLPEALETWPVWLMEKLLPRHMQIIYLINAIHLDGLREKGVSDADMLAPVSLIDEHNGRHVRMGHLAFLGSHKVNGVSALHSATRQGDRVQGFSSAFIRTASSTRPMASPSGAGCSRPIRPSRRLLAETIGPTVFDDPTELFEARSLRGRRFVSSSVSRRRSASNKERLAATIFDSVGVRVDPDALFDVQIKRIHEYKRQLLNVLEAVALYLDIVSQPVARLRAPRQDFRRQGGGELSSGEADHQARQ